MASTWTQEYRTSLVCVDDYGNSVPKGRIYHPYCAEGIAFSSLIQFLTELQGILEDIDFPKAYRSARSFADVREHTTGPPGTDSRTGAQATFAVKILFRQNASWQGSVVWLEEKKEQSFRSVLELILLLNSALQTNSKS